MGFLLEGGAYFFLSRSVVVFTPFKSAPPPSLVQFMPTARNITAYLAISNEQKSVRNYAIIV